MQTDDEKIVSTSIVLGLQEKQKLVAVACVCVLFAPVWLLLSPHTHYKCKNRHQCIYIYIVCMRGSEASDGVRVSRPANVDTA